MNKTALVLFCVVSLFASASQARKNNEIFLDETPEDLRHSLRRVGPAQAARLRKHLEKNVNNSGSVDEFASKSVEALKRLASSSAISDELRQAAETISELPSTVGRCDYQGFTELATGYLIIGGEPKELLDTRDRLARLVLHFALQHKQNCLPKYEQVYAELIKDLPADKFETIESLFDDDLVSSLVATDPLAGSLREFQLEDEIFLQNLIGKFEASGPSVAHLLAQVPVVWPKVFDVIQRQWIDKRLLKQCTDFTFTFKDIVAPMRLDSLTFKGSLADKSRSEGFSRHWRLYRVCMAFQQAASSEKLAESMMDLMYDQQINYHGLK